MKKSELGISFHWGSDPDSAMKVLEALDKANPIEIVAMQILRAPAHGLVRKLEELYSRDLVVAAPAPVDQGQAEQAESDKKPKSKNESGMLDFSEWSGDIVFIGEAR